MNSQAAIEVLRESVRHLKEFPGDDIVGVRQKIIRKLGYNRLRDLPSVDDIEKALYDDHRILGLDVFVDDWARLKPVIIDALGYFSQFTPRVGGALARGVWSKGAVTELYLFADTTEQVQIYLMSSLLDWEQEDKKRKTSAGDIVLLSGFSFYADGYPFFLYVLVDGIRLLDEVTGKQQKLLSRIQLEAMERV